MPGPGYVKTKIYMLPLKGEQDKYINDGSTEKKGHGHLTVNFFLDRSFTTYIITFHT